MTGWESTTFGDRPALRRELRGLNADGPADNHGAEVLQLDEGEVCYWRIDERGRARMSGTRRLVEAIEVAPDHAQTILDAARRALQQRAARERTIARDLIVALQQGRWDDADKLGERLSVWVVAQLALSIAEAEAALPGEKGGDDANDA